MNQTKDRTEDLLLLITKNCGKLIKQTHGKAEETLEFKKIKPRKHFKSIHQFKLRMIGCWDCLIWKFIVLFTI